MYLLKHSYKLKITYIYIEHFKRKAYTLPSNSSIRTSDRHANSLNIPDSSVDKKMNNCHQVLSTTGSNYHIVNLVREQCEEQHCYVTCRLPPCVNLCIHMYTCSCQDFQRGETICKHIHKVHSLSNRHSLVHESDIPNDDIILFTSSCGNNTELKNELKQQRKVSEIRQMINELLNQIEIPSVRRLRLDQIITGLRNIVSANQGCDVLEEASVARFIKTEKIHLQANNVLQNRFRPTAKAPGKKPKTKLKAPAEDKKNSCCQTQIMRLGIIRRFGMR